MMKMEMARKIKILRMEIEMKHTQMILESQKMMMDTIFIDQSCLRGLTRPMQACPAVKRSYVFRAIYSTCQSADFDLSYPCFRLCRPIPRWPAVRRSSIFWFIARASLQAGPRTSSSLPRSIIDVYGKWDGISEFQIFCCFQVKG